MNYEIKPASFGLAVISGKTGKLVSWGQNIVDGRRETFTHAFFVLDNNEVIEAEPEGAQIVSLDKYKSRPEGEVLFCDRPVQGWLAERGWDKGTPLDIATEAGVRRTLVNYARGLKDIPYNYLDYVAIGLEHFGIDLPFIRNRVRRPDRMICSQLVDFIYTQNGMKVLKDNRLSQNVTPGDLEQYAHGRL